MVILVGEQVKAFTYLQWKFGIKLEQRGLRVKANRSVKAHAARMLGLSPRAKAEVVLAEIEKRLAALRPQEA
jgi:hypothetical protein